MIVQRVFFDVNIGSQPAGRIVMELTDKCVVLAMLDFCCFFNEFLCMNSAPPKPPKTSVPFARVKRYFMSKRFACSLQNAD